MKITLVMGDDWDGLYIDGKLVYQRHSVSLVQAMQHIVGKGPVESFETIGADMEWLEKKSEYPDNLEDVVREQP